MPVTPDKSIDLETRNQVMLERVKAQAQKEFIPIVLELEEVLNSIVLKEGLFIKTKKKMNRLRIDSSAIVSGAIGSYLDTDLASSLEDLAADQSEFEFDAINDVVSKSEDDSIATELLVAAFLLLPMSIVGLKRPLLKPFLNDFKNSSVDLVAAAIRQGFAQGKSTNEILDTIRGTKALKFKDGLLAKITRNHKAIVNTAIQHVATSSRQEAMKKKDFVRSYQWISVLDSRTTQICRGLSGQVFEFGKGPLPPKHFNCRSNTAPVIDARFLKGGLSSAGIASTLTYYDWLKDQPEAFQDDAIGPNRGKLLRDGGLTSEQFSKMSLDKNFEPLTLDDMRRKRPNVFKEAGL